MKPSAFWPSLLGAFLRVGWTITQGSQFRLRAPKVQVPITPWAGGSLDHERVLVPDGIHRSQPRALAAGLLRRAPKPLEPASSDGHSQKLSAADRSRKKPRSRGLSLAVARLKRARRKKRD
jgi:hypothetical protein